MIAACREAHHVTDKSLILVNFLKNRLKELKIYYVLLVSNIFFFLDAYQKQDTHWSLFKIYTLLAK